MDKKYLILAIVAVCVIGGCVAWFGFYDNSRHALAEAVADFSHRCPLEMVPGNVIESLTYDEDANNVIAHVAVTNAASAETDDKALQADKVSLLVQDADNRRLLKDMVKAKASLTLSYGDAAGHESIYKDAGADYADSVDVTVEFSPEEVAAIDAKPLLTGKERAAVSLRDRVIMLSGMCPMEWGDDTKLVNIALDPDAKNLVMYLQAPKIESQDYQVKLFKSQLKANQRDSGLVREIMKELASVGYGIHVCYMASDGATIETELDIPAQDIYNISQLH